MRRGESISIPARTAVPLSARARRRNGPSALHSRTAALRAGSPAPSAGPDTPRSFTSFGSGLLYAGAGPPPDDAVSFATDAGVPLRSDAASRGADDGRMGIGELGGSGNGSTTRTRPDSSRSSRPAQRGAPRHEPGLLAAAADAVVVSTPRGPQVHVTPRHSDAASGFAGGAPQPRPAATGTHSFHDVAPPHQASLHVDTATGPSDGNSTVSAAVAAAWGEAERTPRGLARPSSVASHTHSSWAKQRKAMPRRRRHGRSKPPPASRAGGSGSTRTKAAGAGARAGRAGARATGGPAQPRHRSSSTPRSILKTSTSATPRTPRTPGTFGTARTGRGESSAPPNRLTGSRPGPRHTCKVPAPVSDGWKPAGSSACSVCDARQRLFGTTTKLQLVDTVLQLRHSLAQANDRQETTRQEAVRAWTAQRRLQQQLSLSQGRVGVLLEVVRDSVRSMLEFKLEGDALRLGLKGDDRVQYAAQQADRQMHAALGTALSDLEAAMRATTAADRDGAREGTPNTSPDPTVIGYSAMRRLTGGTTSDRDDDGGGAGDDGSDAERDAQADAAVERAVAAFRSAAHAAVAAVAESVNDMHAQRERGVDMCEELGIELKRSSNADAALNHALSVERSSRHEALVEVQRHVQDTTRLKAEIEDLHAKMKEEAAKYSRKIELTAAVLEEFANEVHEDIKKHFGYVPLPMLTKVAKLAPLLAKDGGADMVLRHCLRLPPEGVETGSGLMEAAASSATPSAGAVVDTPSQASLLPRPSPGGHSGGGGAAVVAGGFAPGRASVAGRSSPITTARAMAVGAPNAGGDGSSGAAMLAAGAGGSPLRRDGPRPVGSVVHVTSGTTAATTAAVAGHASSGPSQWVPASATQVHVPAAPASNASAPPADTNGAAAGVPPLAADVSATFLDKWLLQPFGLPSSGAAPLPRDTNSQSLASSWGAVELHGSQAAAVNSATEGGDHPAPRPRAIAAHAYPSDTVAEGPTPQLASVTRWMEQGVSGASSVLARATMAQATAAATPVAAVDVSASRGAYASAPLSARRVSFATATSNGHTSRTRTAPVRSAEPDGSRYASKALVADTYSYAAPGERPVRGQGVLRTADPHYASISSAYGADGDVYSMMRATPPQRLTESLPGVSRVYSHGRVTPDDDFYYHGSRTLGQHFRDA